MARCDVARFLFFYSVQIEQMMRAATPERVTRFTQWRALTFKFCGFANRQASSL